MKSVFRQWAHIVCATLLVMWPNAWAHHNPRGTPSGEQIVLSIGGRIKPAQTTTFNRQGIKLLHGVLHLDLHTLESLPQHRFTTMTPWSHQPIRFQGPLLRDVLKLAGAEGKTLLATAVNDYRVEIPVADALRFNMIVATRMNDQYMSIRDKGPLFVVYPFDKDPQLKQSRYYERSIWQLKSLWVD
jgi:hypothetical protein